MKKLFSTALCIVCLFSSCTKEDGADSLKPVNGPTLVFAQTKDICADAGATMTIDFDIVGGDDDTRLYIVSPAGYNVSVVKHADNASGALTVTFPSQIGNETISVSVTDGRYTNMYALSFEQWQLNVVPSQGVKISCKAQTFDITVETNYDYFIYIPVDEDWLEEFESRTLRTESVTFHASENSGAPRLTEVEIWFGIGEKFTEAKGIATVTVLQDEDSQAPKITFEDAAAKQVCLESWDINRDGELSHAEAADVEHLGDEFVGNQESRTFNELQYLTGISSISGTFEGCVSLESVTIPDNVTIIGKKAFYGCLSLKSIDISGTVTSIKDGAFEYCQTLTSVEIPDSVTEVGVEAFANCTALTTAIIGDNASLGNGVFVECATLVEIHGKHASSDGRCWIKDGVLQAFAPCGVTEYTIPDEVRAIGNSAFHLSAVTNVVIPEGVKSIGNRAFWCCESLASISLPDSITSIGDRAFADCRLLKTVTLPAGITEIGSSAFRGSSITSINIPTGITKIADSTFHNCGSLTGNITIPEGVTSIGEYAFYDCVALESLTLPASITEIGGRAFSGVKKLYCKALRVPTLGPNALYYQADVYVPEHMVESYKRNWGSGCSADFFGYNFPEE